MKIGLILLLTLCSTPSYSKECVILLHGLARTSASMDKLADRLLQERYVVANIDYPSRKHKIDELAMMAVSRGLDDCRFASTSKVNFVTHSLGGILVRQYLSQQKIAKLGRTVMLGPPNKGSEVVDKLKSMPGFTLLNGPAGLQLGTGAQDVPKSLGAANFEVGIIAGTKSINLILSSIIPSVDDGKVSIDSAHLEGESDYITLATAHPFMMRNDEVIDNVVHFLQFGKFIEPLLTVTPVSR